MSGTNRADVGEITQSNLRGEALMKALYRVLDDEKLNIKGTK